MSSTFPWPMCELQHRVRSFANLLLSHLRTWWPAWLLLAASLFSFGHYCELALNRSSSLPFNAFAVVRGSVPSRGDYAAFRIGMSRPEFPSRVIFTKLVAGVPGDVVSVRDRTVFVNGVPVGQALFRSANWPSLKPIQPGLIPPRTFFLVGLARDSLDSRYSVIGLVGQDELVGRAIPLW